MYRLYRAADWKLDEPDWTGRLRVVAKGRELNVKLEDKNSGETNVFRQTLAMITKILHPNEGRHKITLVL